MTEQTSNHEWTIPEVNGSEGVWGEILNDFFNEELDEEISLKGPYNERPVAESGNVKLYLATDRRIVYYNDGTEWEAIYGLGTEANPVPNTSYFESVNIEGLTVDGHRSENHFKLFDYISEEVTDASLSATVSGLERGTGVTYIIEVTRFRERDSNAGLPLNMTISSIGDGEYDYSKWNQSLSATHVTGDDKFELLNTDVGGSDAAMAGYFRLEHPQARPALYGFGSPGRFNAGENLVKGTANAITDSTFDITFSIPAPSESVTNYLDIAVWEANDRSVIQ